MKQNDLWDCIYEAAVVPDRWPEVLGHVSRASGSYGGVLYAITPTLGADGQRKPSLEPRWIACDVAKPIVERFVNGGLLSKNVRAERALMCRHNGFLTDQDIFSPEEIAQAEMYTYLRALGLGWHASLAVQAPSSDVLIFNFERSYKAGPVPAATVAWLNDLKSHLLRAALLSSRLGMIRVQTGTAALQAGGLPAAFLSPGNKIIAHNELFERYATTAIQQRIGGSLHLTDIKADKLLQQALAQTRLPTACATRVLSVPVPARNDINPFVIHVNSLRRSALEIFYPADCILYITEVNKRAYPSATIVQGLFDLTPAEADIAARIARGETIVKIAELTSRRQSTIRQAAKSIFSKIGVRRQSELVSLINSVSVADVQD